MVSAVAGLCRSADAGFFGKANAHAVKEGVPIIKGSAMSGGYISCGDFLGEDKSGSAIAGVFDELVAIMPDGERERFAGDVTKSLQDQLKRNGDHFLIDSEIARLIQPGIESLFARFKIHFSGMTACEALEADRHEGVDPSKRNGVKASVGSTTA